VTLLVSQVKCAVCYMRLAQCLVDWGYGTHPDCDPSEQPDDRNKV
jgi:hypothetical protein